MAIWHKIRLWVKYDASGSHIVRDDDNYKNKDLADIRYI
jgi:hypothetical protein